MLVALKNKQGMSSKDILANRLFGLQNSLRKKNVAVGTTAKSP